MRIFKFRPWLVLPLVAAAFIGAAVAVQSWTLGLLLEDDARGASLAWTRFISGRSADFESIASGAPASAETLDFMRWIESSSRIFRYTIYDKAGRARRVFDQASIHLPTGGN